MIWREKIIELAKGAKDKPAKFGPDLEIPDFSVTDNLPRVQSLDELPKEVVDRGYSVGIDARGRRRLGTYFQYDHSVIYTWLEERGLAEVMSASEALKKYDWIRDYWWKAVPVDVDKYTAIAELNQTHGYFIRTIPEARLTLPIQACLFIGSQELVQCPHNIVIVEEGSELHLITGCAAHPTITKGLQIGISEFYVKRGATLTFTMIHGWTHGLDVRPRTGVIVESGGTFINNYICFYPVKTIQMYPTVYCIGKDSRARLISLICAYGDSIFDVGNAIILRGEGARSEITFRVIAKDKAQVITRGHIVGEAGKTKAHIDCRGLLLSEGAKIHAIPELEAKVEGTELTHEAAVGKIQEEQLYYLMTRGLTEEQATSLIVRGFLDVEILGLPDHLKAEMKRIAQLITEKAL